MAEVAGVVSGMSADLAVVIACSRPERVTACLEALQAQAAEVAMEVYVVGSVAGIPPRFEGLDLHLEECAETHTNLRRNLGIRRSSAPRVAFLDDDAIPRPGWAAAAAALDPRGDRVITGPELPVVRGSHSKLVFSACQSVFTEGTGGHFNTRPRRTIWRKVPFCNTVVPRALFAKIGMPSTDVAWDMDDLEFFTRARERVVFENVPALAIWHDRYPASLCEFVAHKWRRRVRLGEKVIERPDLYSGLPALIACALAPWLALLAVVCI